MPYGVAPPLLLPSLVLSQHRLLLDHSRLHRSTACTTDEDSAAAFIAAKSGGGASKVSGHHSLPSGKADSLSSAVAEPRSASVT
eukprot:9498938-Pyramimonas_sp.AAC.1